MGLKSNAKRIAPRRKLRKQHTKSHNGSDAGWWDSEFGSIFYDSSYSSHDQHSGHASEGYDSHGGHDFGGGADSTGADGGGGDGGD